MDVLKTTWRRSRCQAPVKRAKLAAAGHAVGAYDYVGQRVRKDFGAPGIFEGTVTEVDRSKKPVYSVLYDDGDSENMEWHDLRSLLLSGPAGETESAKDV
jgi:hypothetical protein